jgi:antibiotic biosynthesis monooxygenase (ABM) superfamily enzyme
MWVRSAFWEGKLRPGQEHAFMAEIDNAIAPAMRKLPGVKGVQALWPKAYEDRSTEIVCQFLVFFDSEADLALMISSPGRNAVRERVAELKLRCFEGRISHINYEYAPPEGSNVGGLG